MPVREIVFEAALEPDDRLDAEIILEMGLDRGLAEVRVARIT